MEMEALVKYQFWDEKEPYYCFMMKSGVENFIAAIKKIQLLKVPCSFNDFSEEIGDDYCKDYEFYIADIKITLPSKTDLFVITIITDENLKN